MKTKLLKILSVFVAAALLIGCKGNTNTPEDPQTDESTIKSTSSVNGGGGIIIEAIMKDGTRQYYKVISPSEVGVTSYYAYYASKGFQEYDYKGKVVIPESITHDGTTYSVTQLCGGENVWKKSGAPFWNAQMTGKLNSVTLPRTITKIPDKSVCLKKGETDPANVWKFELVCRGSNPPTLDAGYHTEYHQGDTYFYATIKVPAQSVDAYKAAWAEELAEHISAFE